MLGFVGTTAIGPFVRPYCSAYDVIGGRHDFGILQVVSLIRFFEHICADERFSLV
jgi:hypothetical protein